MGHTKISWAASPRVGAAALFSAAALAGASAITSDEYFAKVLGKQDVRWNSPDGSTASFQEIAVSHGTTAATSLGWGGTSVATDPWQDLEALQDGWDANGALTVSRDAIDHARKFVELLESGSSVFHPFAHPNGSVGLESEKNGKNVYLIVSPTARFAYVFRIGNTVHRGNDVDASAMRDVLALLY